LGQKGPWIPTTDTAKKTTLFLDKYAFPRAVLSGLNHIVKKVVWDFGSLAHLEFWSVTLSVWAKQIWPCRFFDIGKAVRMHHENIRGEFRAQTIASA